MEFEVATPERAQGTVHALRQVIARMEGKEHRLSESAPAQETVPAGKASSVHGKRRHNRCCLGLPPFDEALGGGLSCSGLTEIRSSETRDWGATTGFVAMLIARLRRGRVSAQAEAPGPVVWIADPAARREGGDVWLPGLPGLLPGLDTGGETSLPPLLLVHPRTPGEALWAAETAASGRDIDAVIIELRGNPACMGLTESRRLHFRARESGLPLFLLRQAARSEATAAPARFHVAPAPAAPRMIAPGHPLPESLGRPALTVTLEKSRRPAPLSLTVEWSSHDSRFLLRDTAARDEGRGAGGSRANAPAGPGGAAYSGDRAALAANRPDQPRTGGSLVAFGRAS
ncbi:ImuA family protein [Pseudohoeflea suaedae]|uniref:ImuA family protein n=1 Tax=Pseudohoeflea suaedae TaxID=877384 RepID=UPI001FCE965B|nr:hypothetical protein [Pseudohoeflea suaedae]